MKLVKTLQSAGRVGRRLWRVAAENRRFAVRAFRPGDEAPFDVRLLWVPGVARWRHFVELPEQAARQLELDNGPWALAVRDWIPGTPLARCRRQAAQNWRQWGADLGYILQGLHAREVVHGALRPRDVVVTDGGEVHLVGLPPVDDTATPEEIESSPLVAPELREGSGKPARSADAYSLGALICWMAAGGQPDIGDPPPQPAGDGADHQVPRLPDTIADPVATVVQRALRTAPAGRPDVGELYATLAELGSVHPRRFVALPSSLYRGLERNAVDAIEEGTEAVLLEGDEATGRTYTLRRLRARLQRAGHTAVYASPDVIRGPSMSEEYETSLDRGPFEPVRQLIEALGEDGDGPHDGSPPETCRDELDLMGRLRALYEQLTEVLPGGSTVVLWDDFDATAPDVRTFWYYALRWLDDDGDAVDGQLQLVAATTGEQRPAEEFDDARRFEVVGPRRRAWDSWRARTPLAQLREISDHRWAVLLQRHARRPVELFDAINEDLGADDIPEFATRRPTTRAIPEPSVLFAGDWRRHLGELIERGACVQAAETCRRLYGVLTRSHPRERLQVLRFWLRAAEGSAHQPAVVEQLQSALQEAMATEASRVRASLLSARLDTQLWRYTAAVELLENLADDEQLDERDELQRVRWLAHALLVDGQHRRAGRVATRLLEKLEQSGEDSRPWALHLELVDNAVAAIDGDEEAIDELRRLDGRLADADADPPLRALCHTMRGAALEQRSKLSRAANARVRALELMETGGCIGQLPSYLLEVGRTHRRRGLLGVAREYLQRGFQLVHRGTPQRVRRQIRVELAELQLLFGRIDAARRLVEGISGRIEDLDEPKLKARCFRLAAGICCAESQPQRALDYFERARRQVAEDGWRGRFFAGSADAALQREDPAAAADFVEQAARIADRCGLERLQRWVGMLRARLQLAKDDPLERIGGVDRLRFHLEQAEHSQDWPLIVEQLPRLWDQLPRDIDSTFRDHIADTSQRARREITAGLSDRRRRRLLETVPGIATDEDSDQPAVGTDSTPQTDRQLAEQNRRLREQLEESRRRIEQLEERCRHLEQSENDGQNDPSSGRGRRPKATRQQVMEALEQTGDDFDEAAELLGVSKRTLYRYVNRYGL